MSEWIPDRISPWREDLTQRELMLLEAVGEGPSQTTVEILGTLGAPNTHEIREVIIERLTRLEGKGLLRRLYARGSRPTTWELTFRGRRTG